MSDPFISAKAAIGDERWQDGRRERWNGRQWTDVEAEEAALAVKRAKESAEWNRRETERRAKERQRLSDELGRLVGGEIVSAGLHYEGEKEIALLIEVQHGDKTLHLDVGAVCNCDDYTPTVEFEVK